jgi:pullulanase
MYESFGAVVQNQAVDFKLFFPDVAVDPTQYSTGGLPRIARLQVAGDFQSELGSANWNLTQAPELVKTNHPNGWLYTFHVDALPDGFYQYKYFVTYENGTTRWCGDPCTKYVAGREENSAFVVGGNDMTVAPIQDRRPLGDLVIYELMIDDFTAAYRGSDAPVDAVSTKLDHLVGLGVNAIELMPWTAWRGSSFSWGYDPFLFFAVENSYIEDPTNPLDRLFRLKRLVDELHRRGVQVIMDGVFNHVSAGLNPDTGFPYHWLYQDPSESPFTGGFAGGGYFEDLDYNNPCTEQFIFDVCKFWLDEYQLDGIRFDYTLGFYREGDTTRGIPKLVGDLKRHLRDAGRENVSFILEHLTDNRYEAINATNAICATACWYDRFLYDIPQAAADGRAATGLVRVLDTHRDVLPGKGPVAYIENHDHSTVVHRVGGRGRWWKIQAPLIALLTSPGAVMLHNGQELGDDYFLPNDGDGRVTPRPVRWSLADDAIGTWLTALHTKLIRLRKEHPALRSSNFYPSGYDERQAHFNDQGYGVDVDKGLAIYHRWGDAADGQLERFIVVLNFSSDDQFVDVPFSTNGAWQELLDGRTVDVHGFRLPNQRINSNWGRIYCQKG